MLALENLYGTFVGRQDFLKSPAYFLIRPNLCNIKQKMMSNISLCFYLNNNHLNAIFNGA